jgi:hypothetical protein
VEHVGQQGQLQVSGCGFDWFQQSWNHVDLLLSQPEEMALVWKASLSNCWKQLHLSGGNVYCCLLFTSEAASLALSRSCLGRCTFQCCPSASWTVSPHGCILNVSQQPSPFRISLRRVHVASLHHNNTPTSGRIQLLPDVPSLHGTPEQQMLQYIRDGRLLCTGSLKRFTVASVLQQDKTACMIGSSPPHTGGLLLLS